MGTVAWVWLAAVGLAEPSPGGAVRFQYERSVMNVPIKLVLYDKDETNANSAAEAVFQRILRLNFVLSDYDDESELLQLVKTAGQGKIVPVSDDLWRVLVHSQALSERSGGAFDITINPVVRLWRKARRTKQLPSPEDIARARALVDYRNIRLYPDKKAVELSKPGMRLDVGGVAKGYVCDEALAVLRKHGIDRAMIVAGGDIGLGDPPPGHAGWTIGVGSLDVKSPPSQYLSLARCGVATSGDMFQYVEIGGKRYSHIVDPKTGLGLTNHRTVTIVARDGITADGFSTAVSVLGPEKGLPLIEETPGAAALILETVDGRVVQRSSGRWKDLPRSEKKAE